MNLWIKKQCFFSEKSQRQGYAIFCMIIYLSIFPLSEAHAEQKDRSEMQMFAMQHFNRKPKLDQNKNILQDVVIKTNPENKTVTFLESEKLSAALKPDMVFQKLLASSKYAEAAIHFIKVYKSIFKLVHPEEELKVESIKNDKLNFRHVRIRQEYSGISVWGSEIIVHVNPENHIYLINGRYIPTPAGLDLKPLLTCSDVEKIIYKNFPERHNDCANCRIRLIIFGPPDSNPHLAYQAFVQEKLVEVFEVLIDAQTGDILKKIPSNVQVEKY